MDNHALIVDLPSFEEILQEYKSENYWGISVTIDLYHCHPQMIRDPSIIDNYITLLCKEIDMKPFGEPIIEHFGNDEKINGFSFMQLIETSSITGHFSNFTNAAYIDIFSCKLFDPREAIQFSSTYFEAKNGNYSYIFR